ncbi:hypothetical protein BDV30DRAFT_223719 [Aspergillus minisclerotigenes]|uniref:Transcription factor domain-containing protein n=1 Tax=Aspergillus minisclerotigenes TaxID=656917 RepID=A0A5N6JH06_9EURO|nr:hypothetical protein BDV30DRAFT_223719 [Aspergillus minisclerotigenes]
MLYYTPSITANIDFDGVPMNTTMHLLDLHWNRLHLRYLLTYRPPFMDSLLNNGPYVNKLLMNAIYIQSSLYSDRNPLLPDTDDPRASGMAIYGRFKSLLVHYIDKPDLPTVVALLLCGACLVQYGKQSAGWVFCDEEYTGVPMPPTNINPFISVKIQLCTCPRPMYLRSFIDSFEELEEWKPYIDPNVELCNAKAPMYRDEWRSGLPSHLSFDSSVDDPPPPHQMTLYATYWTLVILTQQPVTTQNRFGINLHSKVKHEAMDKCIEAASNIRALAEAYQRAFTLRRAQFGISYAIYSAVLILLQSDSQGRDDYTEACRFFWSALLEYQQGCGSGLKKPLALLKSLMLRVARLAPCITDNTSDAGS